MVKVKNQKYVISNKMKNEKSEEKVDKKNQTGDTLRNKK